MYRMSLYTMLVLRILISIFVSRATSLELPIARNSNNYGPYNTKFYNYKECSGPRSKNVTISSSTIFFDQFGTIATYNITFLVPAKMDVFKGTVWNVKGDQKSVLWNFKVNKPCQHFLIAGLLQKYYRDMHNCVVPPGDYTYKTNYTDIMYQFLGNSFFYGDYSFKTNMMAKEGNIMCFQINALFSKKV